MNALSKLSRNLIDAALEIKSRPWSIPVDKLFWAMFMGFFVFGFQLNGLSKSITGSFVFDKIFIGAFYVILIASILFGERRRVSRWWFVFVLYSVFALVYSVYLESNTIPAIALDYFSQTKPFFCLFGALHLRPRLTRKVIWWLKRMALFGIFQALMAPIVGKLWFYYCHPSNQAAVVVLCSIIYLYLERPKPNARWFALGMMLVGIMSGRSKFFAFFAVASVMLLGSNSLHDLRFRVKNFLAAGAVIVLAGAAAISKIMYYAHRMRAEEMARPLMYIASGRILLDYFPFGSGFASIGNIASIQYYSKTYREYGLDHVWGLAPGSDFSFAMDAYFPNLAQFGVAGVAVLIAYLFWILRKMRSMHGNARLAAVLVVVFLVLDSLADTTLTSFRGTFSMLLLGVIISNECVDKNDARN